MTLNVNNNFNSLPKDISNYIFSYLSSPDLRHVALTSKEMNKSSLSQRLKKAREILEEASKFQGIIQLPSFNPKSEDIKEYNTAICSLHVQQKIKSIPILQEIFETNHGDFSQTAQEIRDRDLVIVFKQIAPPEIQKQMEGLSNSQAAALARNWLKTLDPQDDFFQIVDLQLPMLQLTSIPPEIFTYFPNLQALNLRENDIQVIPPQIGQLQNLQTLHLNCNQIQVIPPEIGQLQNLQSLNLVGNQIQVIPPQIGQLQKLQSLDLSNNQIRIIPPQIGQLQKLLALSLDYNQIQVIPSQMGQLKNLQWLHLENNQIKDIPPQIRQLQKLRLFFNNSQIKSFPLKLNNCIIC